jgi:glycosyltransferase involved in cell wall biosynthesis
MLGVLCLQDVAEPFEVLVCDDGSDDATPETVARLARRTPYELRYLRRERDGRRPAAARNLGLRHARGSLIVLLDDDMLARPDLLRTFRGCHADPDAVGIGYVYFLWPQPGLGLGFTCEPDPRETAIHNPDVHRRPWVLMTTASLALSRDLVERAGGFDERFVGWGVEDTEFAYRLYLLGAEFQICRRAVAWHCSEPSDPWMRWTHGVPLRLGEHVANLERFRSKFADDDDVQQFIAEISNALQLMARRSSG